MKSRMRCNVSCIAPSSADSMAWFVAVLMFSENFSTESIMAAFQTDIIDAADGRSGRGGRGGRCLGGREIHCAHRPRGSLRMNCGEADEWNALR